MTDKPDFDLRGQEPAPEVPAEPGPGVEDSPWSAPADPGAEHDENEVDEASEDSFPASDAPGWTDTSSTRDPDEEPPKSF